MIGLVLVAAVVAWPSAARSADKVCVEHPAVQDDSVVCVRDNWQTVDVCDRKDDGHRTFALTEIMIRGPWRRQGYARHLHDALLRNRKEERATLLVLPDNAPAKAAYAAWGWRKLGELKPFEDSPTYDSMIVSLPAA